MLRPPAVAFAALLLGTSGVALAQTGGVLVGRVLDAQTGAGLPGVNVYLNRTLQGTSTDADGTYRLEGAPLGLHEVVASFVGYEPEARTVTVRPDDEIRLSFALSSRTSSLGEVTVVGDRSEWRRQLARFERAFLGEGPNARGTRLLNPEVLSFDEAGGTFRAEASAPLQVVNRALGYQIEYDLVRFEEPDDRVSIRGHGRFTELDPDGGRSYEGARRRAYAGSFQHFVHTLAAGGDRIAAPFRVYFADRRHRRTPVAARGADQITPVRTAGQVFGLGPDGRVASLTAGDALLLRVDYEGEEEERAYVLTQPGRDRPGVQVSWVEMPAGVARLDVLGGQAFDPYPVELSGYWGWEERISNWLPREYRPD